VILVGDDDVVLPTARFKEQWAGHFVLNTRDDGLAGNVERVGKLLQRTDGLAVFGDREKPSLSVAWGSHGLGAR